jgi:hypothetical protein
MRFRLLPLALGSLFALGACSSDPVSSGSTRFGANTPIDLVPDFAVSNAWKWTAAVSATPCCPTTSSLRRTEGSHRDAA